MNSNNTTVVTMAANKNLIFENGKNGCLLVDESLKLLVLTKKRWPSLFDEEKKKVLETYGYKQVIEQKVEESGNVKESFVYSAGKSLYILPNEIAEVVNFYEYPLNLLDNARLFNHFYGDDFLYDPERAAVYIFQQLEYNPELGTSGCYWMEDIADAKTRESFDGFAAKMHEALKLLVTPYLTENDEINKERINTILVFRGKIEKRYKAFSDRERNYIIERFKDIKGCDKPIKFNDVLKTGSLIPCLNGCYDLTKHGEAGAFRSTRRDDYLTMYAPTRYVPDAKNDHVTKFLQDVTCGCEDLEDYLAMSIAVGIDQNSNFKGQFTYLGSKTNNGKSTFVNAMVAALGKSDKNGLAQTLRPEAFSKTFTQGSTLTADLSTIGFARCIFISEPDKSLKIDSAGLKRITSPGTQITINPKYAKPYHIEVHFVLYWDTNYTIIPDDVTVYSSGRMKVLPWDFVPEEFDTELSFKLSTDEAKSAWLNWIIEGHQKLVANGGKVTEPDYCKDMVKKQEKLSDRLGDFLTTYYMASGSDRKNTKLKAMYEKYKNEYREENGLVGQMSSYEFKRSLSDRGYKIEPRSNSDHVIGVVEKTFVGSQLTANAMIDIFDLTLTAYRDKDENGSITVAELFKWYTAEAYKHGQANVKNTIWGFIELLTGTHKLSLNITGSTDGQPDAVINGYIAVNNEQVTRDRIFEYKHAFEAAAKATEKAQVYTLIDSISDIKVKDALRTVCARPDDFIDILKAIIDVA